MEQFYLIGFLVCFFGFILILLSGKRDMTLNIKSKKDGTSYTVKKKKKSKNQTFLDWFYYTADGKSIENEDLKKLIYEAFYDEDWYGDYEFVVNDVNLVEDMKSPEDILGGEMRPYFEKELKKTKQVSHKK